MSDAKLLERPAAKGPRAPKKPQKIIDDAHALDEAHHFAERWRDRAILRDREKILPFEEIEDYTAKGLHTVTVPKNFGGPDVSFVTLAKIFEIISAVDGSLGQIPQNHFGVLGVVRDFGTPAQQARIYRDVLNGFRIGNAGPERKTKTIAVSTTVLRDTPQGLRLSGTRFYSTGAIFGHYIPTRAIDEQGRAIQVWAAHDAPGVNVLDDWDSFGQRATSSGTVVFDNVPIDPLFVFPLYAFADRASLAGPSSQLVQAAIDAGLAKGALEDAKNFVREKSRPWMDSGVLRAVDDPTIIHSFGELYAELHAAQEVLYAAGQVLDEAIQHPVDAASSAKSSVAVAEAKILTTEIALKTSENLFDLAGSSATRAPHDLDRHWRNARVHTLHDPVRWKRHLLGHYDLNGVFPARHQWN